MNLVITRSPLAIRAYERGGVIHFSWRSRRGVTNANTTCEQPRITFTRNVAYRIAEQRISVIKQRRILRPNNQVGMRCTLRVQTNVSEVAQRVVEIRLGPIGTF